MKFKEILICAFLIGLLLAGCKDDSTSPEEVSSNMTLIGNYNTPDYAFDVSIFSAGIPKYAFIADGTSGLQIINVTTPSNPILITNYNTPGSAIAVYAAEINNSRFAFVSDGLQGLVILNVSNIATPVKDTTLFFQNDRVLTSFADESNAVLYVGTYYGNIYLYNISNLPNSVSLLASYTSPLDKILGIYVTDGIAYAAEGNLGIELINVSNPSNPQNISYYDTPGYSYDVQVGGNYAYVADETSLYVVNVTNPFNPVFAGMVSTQNAAYLGVTLNFPFQVYTADYDYGVETFSIGTPSSPTQAGFYRTSGFSINIEYLGGYVYVAAGSEGLLILKYQ